MKVDKLFQVLVVAGASSTVGLGLGGCGDDDEGGTSNTGGTPGSGGGTSSGGAAGSGGSKATGGTAGAGGGPVTGGATSSGGASTGGSKATGGTSSGGASSGGVTSSGGASSGGASSGGASSGGSNNTPDAAACEARCEPNDSNDSWTDCGGCCCWLAAGETSPAGPICGADELCCIGRGRD